MTYKAARKLHNEDEVIDKKTGESVRVLSIRVYSHLRPQPMVIIEGIGEKAGYLKYGWTNLEVR